MGSRRPRRLLAIGLAVMMVGWSATTGEPQSCPHDSDANQDGRLTPADALLAFQQFLGIAAPPLDACQQDHANVLDPAGRSITPADALCIFRRFLGLPSCLETCADLAGAWHAAETGTVTYLMCNSSGDPLETSL